MSFELIDTGGSRSFPEGFSPEERDCAVILGNDSLAVARALKGLDPGKRKFVAVELGTECLGFHVGDAQADNVVGFARFRMGDAAPSPVIELVRLPSTSEAALAAATELFARAGLEVCVCSDFAGRIVDSLMRPYLNAALQAIDEGIADAKTLDLAIRMGLGYPKGPIELLEQTGLAAHGEVSAELHAALGTEGFVPARRARTAALRKKAGL